MPHTLSPRCLVCASALLVERVRCTACHTSVEGQFGLDWIGALSTEQLAFVKVFLSSRGKIKDVEQALGLSYPTVISRLDDIVTAIGAEPATAKRKPAHDVLDALAEGAIDVDEAVRRLKKP